jgi:hypothetical protein
MRTLLLLSIAAILSTAAPAQDDCRCWTPTAEQIAALETNIERQPLPLNNLARYARYYAGVIDRIGDRSFIRGKLVPLAGNNPPGIHIVEGKMPPLQGAGCVSSSDPTNDR